MSDILRLTLCFSPQAAAMRGLTWDASAAVAPGANHLALQATETSPAAGFNVQMTVRHLDFTLNANRERTFTYDGNGSLTDANGTVTYEWDGANRLSAITYAGTSRRSEFSYDGLSRWTRIVEKNGAAVLSDKRFVWDGFTLAEERDGAGNVVKRFYEDGVQIVSLNSPPSTLNFFYTRDHLGSIREVTDGTGAVVARYDYDPWGERLKQAGTFESDFGFTGHYFHVPSGLYLAPYRAYDASVGRWLSRDPIGEEGGINLYSYVGNDPANMIDPLGLEAVITLSDGKQLIADDAADLLKKLNIVPNGQMKCLAFTDGHGDEGKNKGRVQGIDAGNPPKDLVYTNPSGQGVIVVSGGNVIVPDFSSLLAPKLAPDGRITFYGCYTDDLAKATSGKLPNVSVTGAKGKVLNDTNKPYGRPDKFQGNFNEYKGGKPVSK